MSRTYNSDPARFARELLVISTVRPPIGLSLCVILERLDQWQNVVAVPDYASIVTFRHLLLSITLIEGRLLNKTIFANSTDDRPESLEPKGSASRFVDHVGDVVSELQIRFGRLKFSIECGSVQTQPYFLIPRLI